MSFSKADDLTGSKVNELSIYKELMPRINKMGVIDLRGNNNHVLSMENKSRLRKGDKSRLRKVDKSELTI